MVKTYGDPGGTAGVTVALRQDEQSTGPLIEVNAEAITATLTLVPKHLKCEQNHNHLEGSCHGCSYREALLQMRLRRQRRGLESRDAL